MVQPGTWVTLLLLTGHMGDTREVAREANRVVRGEPQSEERSDEDAGLPELRGDRSFIFLSPDQTSVRASPRLEIEMHGDGSV